MVSPTFENGKDPILEAGFFQCLLTQERVRGRGVIIVRIYGGVGNQLFQYAAGRALALHTGQSFKLDIRPYHAQSRRKYRLCLFNTIENLATPAEATAFLPPKRLTLHWVMSQLQRQLWPYHLRPLIRERTFAFDPALFRVKHSAYLYGYWQSEHYFSSISHIIRNEFTLRPTPSDTTRRLIDQMANSQSISLHIRRGDYISDKFINQRHGVLPNDYYRAAVQRISESVPDPHFFVFSDEIHWAKENLRLPYPTTYVDHNGADQEVEDLRLMSHCHHHIIANSSFSWWGAWLANFPDKRVIAPRRWFTNPNQVKASLYPAGWIIL